MAVLKVILVAPGLDNSFFSGLFNYSMTEVKFYDYYLGCPLGILVSDNVGECEGDCSTFEVLSA